MGLMMGAVRFHGPGELCFERITRPGVPVNSQVRVRVEAAGICGSDLHVYQTGHYVTQIPVVMGHEFAGTVIDVGDGVQGLENGDHVIGDSRVFCGQCRSCQAGQPNLCVNLGFLGEVCDGAYAEEITVNSSSLVQIRGKVPFEIAALAEPISVALHAFRIARVSESCRVLILGAGPVGALIHTILDINGLSDTHVIDISEYRRRVIAQVDPNGVVSKPQGQYDMVFETTGSSSVIREVLPNHMIKGGKLIMVGLFGCPAPFDFNQVVENEWTIKGSSAFSTELPEAVKLLENDWRRFEHIVSHKMHLQEFQEAFDLLLSCEKEAMKIVFTPAMMSG
jgi:(R,R)-butanediol dehydrogenase/meso-butanediol dehydrogenase/diacetyl reductase